MTNQTPPAVWIDGDPLMEAIAAAVWERCERSDSGLVIDDPRNIAAAAVAAVSSVGQTPATGRALLLAAADRIAALCAEVDDGDDDAVGVRWGLNRAEYELRQWAVEAAVPGRTTDETTDETLRPATTEWTFEACYDADNDKWHGVGGTYSDHAEAKDAFKRRAENDSDHVKHSKFRLVRATTTYTVEAEHTPAVDAPAVGGAQQPTEDRPPVAYSDGKGRVFCVACPRPDGTDVPLTVEDVDHWELCPSCGRHVVDVARDFAQQGHGAP
jgi:hypothetical protein